MLRLTRLLSALAVLIVACCGLPGCAQPLSEDECDRLLDHYTEHLLRSERPDVSAQTIAEKQSAARALARADARFEFETCPDAVSRAQFDCAIIAPSVDAIEKCLVL